jgi:hypothetical protein
VFSPGARQNIGDDGYPENTGVGNAHVLQSARRRGGYLNGLIESGQVERFDEDLKRVDDIGSSEIVRQRQQQERGNAADQAREGRLRQDTARGNDRAVPESRRR